MEARREQTDGRRYRLLYKLGSGGMAEVFAAERSDPGLAPQRVAIKRLLAHLRDDPTITGMFTDEIRLARRCSHPNLVKLVDAGRAEGVPYAVMELVDGIDLRGLQQALKRHGRRFELADAVFVAMELCRGLHYLHELCDEEGQPLSVVHRDVTPPNVLLGVRGEVKLCDFGLAKSRQQHTLTEPGLVKGKFSYLSPEAAHGGPVDARTDIFAVGILLWEMLAMRRLFDGPTDYETVKLVQKAEVPPLCGLAPVADEVLQEIVAKALAREPEQRFQSAVELYNSLAAYADWQELEGNLGPLVGLVRVRTSTPVSGIRLRG